MVIELSIDGNVPSKKNSRIHTRAGVSLPNKNFMDWQKSAIQQTRLQTKERCFKPVGVEVIIYFGTNARADLDNRVTSILDMLVEAVVLRDDKWQDVPRIAAEAVYRKGSPGAFIRITELA